MIRDDVIHADIIADIARAHDLHLVMLYGSVARATETAVSDVDIGVLARTPLSYEDGALIAEEVAQATDIPNIEVHSLHHASPLFISTVMNEGIVLYQDTPTRAQEFALYAWKLAAETKPLRDAQYNTVRQRIEAYV